MEEVRVISAESTVSWDETSASAEKLHPTHACSRERTVMSEWRIDGSTYSAAAAVTHSSGTYSST